jgi:hypothetical protein
MQPRLASNSQSSCLRFPSADITGVHHHTQPFLLLSVIAACLHCKQDEGDDFYLACALPHLPHLVVNSMCSVNSLEAPGGKPDVHHETDFCVTVGILPVFCCECFVFIIYKAQIGVGVGGASPT